ncbi:MAG: helix-turn-helix transcriptional regulator, partial [Fimbriimonas ginsengisoli]|nr:helix-turn-helix transcriptional regulator [Fimbriimonas ginsengisoli]
VVGCFALYAQADHEAEGTVGAMIQLLNAGTSVFRQDLLNGRHYREATDLEPWRSMPGDGSSVESVGLIDIDGVDHRVDLLAIDLPMGIVADHLHFTDLGSASSFLIFDVLFEFDPVHGCPFRSSSGGVALADLPALIRIGDRVRFNKAYDQLISALQASTDLDEARSQALTFLALVTAGTLEMGGSRDMHRVQLDAARALDSLQSAEAVAEVAGALVSKVADAILRPRAGPSARLMDRAMALVERHYARDLRDQAVAEQLGLSTSHFRYLFREATGQPFHQYVTALRLEKARRLLIESAQPVSEIAGAVGFGGLSHFSRAFSQRFSISPANFRRSSIMRH